MECTKSIPQTSALSSDIDSETEIYHVAESITCGVINKTN